MQKSSITFVTFLFLITIFSISCGTEDPFEMPDPDFTTVPDQFEFESTEPVEIEEGVLAYKLEENDGPFKITARDQVLMFLTLRTDTGEIIYSTFSDDRSNPINVSMRLADGLDPSLPQLIAQQVYTILLTYSPGFKAGILDMREGEKRTLVVSPEKGFENIPQNGITNQYRENTLIYDIRISSISPKKVVD